MLKTQTAKQNNIQTQQMLGDLTKGDKLNSQICKKLAFSFQNQQ